MNIKIIAIGKIKEKYLKDALNDYIKRLAPFCSFSVVEIPSEPILDDSLSDKYKISEAQKIIPFIKKNSYVITLEINGKSLSSPDFACKIKNIAYDGFNEIIFIIGGPNGLDISVSALADFKLSFSKMTFTHQLIRLLLIEQIYRAFKINANEPYHR